MAAASAALRFSALLGFRGAAAGQTGKEPPFALLVGAAALAEARRRGRTSGAAVRCQRAAAAGSAVVDKKGVTVVEAQEGGNAGGAEAELTVVMKFGGSSVASAERMREVADLILSFPEEWPVVVLSAMGKTTNKLLMAGERSVGYGATKVSELEELTFIKEFHLGTIDQLGLERSIVSGLLDELEQLLKGIAMMKELTLRTRDYLVSFGECMSTRIFAAFLNKLGVKARQYDAFDVGFITAADFTNSDILEATYPVVAKRLHGDWVNDPAIPIVTGFLGKGWKSGAITTLGRGGSDLTVATIGKALGLREIQNPSQRSSQEQNRFFIDSSSRYDSDPTRLEAYYEQDEGEIRFAELTGEEDGNSEEPNEVDPAYFGWDE